MVFHLIKRHLVKNKLAMLLLFLCQFASLLAVIFIFSLNIGRDNYAKVFEEDRRAITLSCSSVDTESLTDIFASGVYENISLFVTDENGISVRQNLSLRELPPLYLSTGRYFREEELTGRENVAVVKYDSKVNGKNLKTGDTLTLWGRDYTVIGCISILPSMVEVPWIDGYYEGASVMFFLPESVPLSDYAAYAAQLQARLSATQAEYPVEEAISGTDLYSSAMSLFLFLIANVNFVALYYYLLMRERQTVSVFRMCGCTVRRCAFLLLSEFLLLSLLPFILASLTYHFGLNWVLPYMNENVHYAMGLKDYGLVLLTYLCGLLLVFVPVIWRYSRKSPVALHRHA